MAIKQFVRIIWDENKSPQFALSPPGGKSFRTIPAKGKIYLKKLDKKFCTGYFNLDELREYPCPDNKDMTNSRFGNCWDCLEKTGFSSCVRCNGSLCSTTSEKARSFCQKPHLVYLVYFGQDIYKVGTAVETRSQQRLLEQGASYSCLLARSDGLTARRIEKHIGKQGIKTSLNWEKKMGLFIQGQPPEKIFSKMEKKIEDLKNTFPEDLRRYLIKPKFNNFYPQNLPNVLYQVSKSDEIKGEIISIVGSIALIKNGYFYTAINLKSFFGWLVNIDIENC